MTSLNCSDSRHLSLTTVRPIDIMHLLLLNIGKNMVDLFFSQGLIDPSAERQINDSLSRFGSVVPSITRRPRTLKYRRMFKAEEWKSFIIHSSLVVFDTVLGADVMKGWRAFQLSWNSASALISNHQTSSDWEYFKRTSTALLNSTFTRVIVIA